MRWLIDRLGEYSTWVGIFTFAGLFGMHVRPELRELIINAILGVAAVVAFIFREKVKKQESDEHLQLPPIDLVGRSERSLPSREATDFDSRFRRYRDPDDELRDELPTDRKSEQESGWNG